MHDHDLMESRERSMRLAIDLYTTKEFGGGPDADAQLEATADTIRNWIIRPDENPALTALEARITQLEDRMALTDTALEDLNAATNEVATELDELRGELSATDASVAERIGAAATRLRGLAADPEQPVPPVEPTPEPVPGEPV